MQPEPFSSNPNPQSQAQPFADSTAQPVYSAPIPAPVGASPATSLPPASPTGVPDAATGEATNSVAALAKAHLSGANWFFWIVGLSLVNTALIAFGSEITMAIGTSATLFMDVMAKDEVAKNANMVGFVRGLEVVFDLFVFGFYALCGIMAARGKVWAFYVGMFFFALDMVLSVLFQQIMGTLIHAWALFTMFQGVSALKQLHALRRAAQAPATPWAA